ncbi:MAG: PD40 domain-containing protein [Planctomycetes bacterium]|nr:PD40 domain-containing protein [Planctomycetota bacterium]
MKSHYFSVSLFALSFATFAQAQSTQPSEKLTVDWREAEAQSLTNHVQLTHADRFYKAGESYFSPDDSKIIFQAVEVPNAGQEPDPFYAMFIADVVRSRSGKIMGLENYKRLSPPGSANTCGWFHPTDPNVVIFGSTIIEPVESEAPGFARDTKRYRWMFPPEMRVVRCELDKADGTVDSLEIIYGDAASYQAECSLTKDARHLLVCDLSSGSGDLFVKDMTTGEVNGLVQAAGYDGGPFFSPDQKRICFRSDRRNDHYLQIFIGDISYDDNGQIIGLEREYQITDNGHVNWAPFWHPNSRFLVYATSEIGHSNYEVFIMDADPGNLDGDNGPVKYGTRRRRITHAARTDVLPAFNSDGSVMIWTSQRGEDGMSQVWAADFVLNLTED